MQDVYLPTFFPRHLRTLRATMIDNQPWFAAVDLARLLAVRYPHSFHQRFQPHETRRVHLQYESGREEPVDMLSEPALYKALVRFGHPELHSLEHWLSHEVIPTLRDLHSADDYLPRRVVMSLQQQRMTLLEWQGELWVPLENVPRLMQAR